MSIISTACKIPDALSSNSFSPATIISFSGSTIDPQIIRKGDMSFLVFCSPWKPSDIMHDILEGVLPLHMKAMLLRFVIENKYFSLDELNRRLLHFLFGFTDSKNRPSIVKNLNLAGRHMNQSGIITQSYCDVQ